MADPKEENIEDKNKDDKVAAAYENISRKLEDIRSGKIPEDDLDEEESKESSDSEGELDEWKGPEGVKSEETDEEEMELRRIKLKNPEDEEESEEAKDLDEATDKDIDEETEDEESKESEKEVKKDWKPSEDDPLDEEDGSEHSENSEKPEDSDSSERSQHREPEKAFSDESDKAENLKDRPAESSEFSGDEAKMDSPKKKDPQPDTLDDLAGDDYDIPNLKGTGQTTSNIGYNSPQRINEENLFSDYNKPSEKSSMENNDPNNFFSQHNQSQPPKRANKFHLLILVVIGIAVIGFTVYILKGGFGEIGISSSNPSPSPSSAESPSPTPTPSPEPDRASIKVRVLNGSGKTGLAASVSAKLKELGYQTEKTGNASNSAFTQTTVRVKPSLESFIPQIVKDLTPDFDAAGNTSLKDDDTIDIEIILGAK